MLQGIQLIRNIGQFDSAQTPAQPSFAKLTLIYAENGRGKTTLAAVLRSLADNDPSHIDRRHRLKAAHPPHVVIPLANGTKVQFQNGQWTGTPPGIAVFDDEFVAQNVCSGIDIAAEHRQNLHELIIGAQGVTLNAALQTEVDAIEAHNRQMKTKGDDIPAAERRGLSIDAFCALPLDTDVTTKIAAAEKALAVVKSSDAVKKRGDLCAPTLPAMPLEDIRAILAETAEGLNAEAAARVQNHIGTIGEHSESWIAEGVTRIHGDDCPFCRQSLSTSDIIKHYEVYFGDAYQRHKSRIIQAIETVEKLHAGDIPASFERSVREYIQDSVFWRQFITVPEIAIDTAAISREWKAARDGVLAALRQKQMAPLEVVLLPEPIAAASQVYEATRAEIEAHTTLVRTINAEIARVKERALVANAASLEADLAKLKATEARHSPALAPKCDAYLAEKTAKAATEQRRDQARAALDQYRSTVFPAYEAAINGYLGTLNASFRLGSVASVNIRGGSTVNYAVLIDNEAVPLVADGNKQSFRTSMSAGDRNTLALAFFFASLEQSAAIGSMVVVIDDPMTSLDEHRTLATRHLIGSLLDKAAQVIVLSHAKPFLCDLWEELQKKGCTPFKLARANPGSAISAWDVHRDCIKEHDKRHALVTGFLQSSVGADERAVAAALRPILEAYVRVAYPGDFAPGDLLGPFCGICQQRLASGRPILVQQDVTELRQLLDYANKFHHDTNPAYATELINDQELTSFSKRVIGFTRR